MFWSKQKPALTSPFVVVGLIGLFLLSGCETPMETLDNILAGITIIGERPEATPQRSEAPTRLSDMPPQLTSSWVKAAKAALPAKYSHQNLNFQQLTNLLCRESQHGNYTAQGLWGFALLAQSKTKREADANSEIIWNAAQHGDAPTMVHLGVLLKPYNQYRVQVFYLFNMAADRGDAEDFSKPAPVITMVWAQHRIIQRRWNTIVVRPHRQIIGR